MKNFYPTILIVFFSLLMVNSYGQEDTPLFSQERNPEMGTGSSVALDGEGYFSADDIIFEENTTISSFTFRGYQFQNNLEDIYTGAVLYIYEDNDGVPNGIPGKSGTPYYSLDLDASDSELEMIMGDEFDYDFNIQTPNLTLEGNTTYWVVFAIKIDFETKLELFEMWNWYNSTTFNFNDAVNIDPDDFFGSGLTFWMSISEMTGGMFGDDVKGLAFYVYGEEETVNTEEYAFDNQIQVYPIPAHNEINISGPQNSTIKEVKIYDLAGRLVLSDISHSTLDISTLTSGAYMVEILFSTNHISKRKIIKL